MDIRMERIWSSGKKLNFRVAKANLALTMLLAMAFLVSASNVHAANGDFVWAKSMGGTSDALGDQGHAIVVDGSGNVYTTGRFYGTVDFDPGPDHST